MDTIKLKRAFLSACTLITQPGKYFLQVSNDVTEKNLVANADGTAPRYIVGLKAITEDKLAQAREVFGENEEVNIEQTNGLFLTANIWQTGSETLPVKGEVVEAVVDYVTPRDGEELVLRVTNIRVKKAINAPKVNLEKLFAAQATPAMGSTLAHS